MADELPEGTEITCPLCGEETTTVKRNKKDKPYFYCAELEAAVNMNAPVAHTESFLRQFADGDVGGGSGRGSDTSGSAGSAGVETSDSTDITTREG